jgi:hypothetical protein
MKRTPLPIVDGCYADETRAFSVQDTVNYIPVTAEQAGTRSPLLAVDAPGLREVVEVGDGPHRCGIVVGGQRLVVSGTSLYRLDNDDRTLLIGTIPGEGRVSATSNQANQVAFGTGSSGYVYDTQSGALTQITDSAFPGAIVFDYIGQLGVSLDPSRQFFRNSAINDLSAYSALEKYQGEASPDLLVGIKVCHSELLAFSQTTTEVFDQTTDPASIADHILFVNKKITIQRGCASAYCVVNLDNSVLFVGDDGSVYRLDGYTPVRIPTFPIEQALAKCDLSKCFAFAWEDRGHKVYYLTCPDGNTWGYDVASRKWHRRQSYGLNRWRLNTLFEWNGVWYGGSFNSGMLYRLDWDHVLEGPDPLPRKRVLGVLHANQNMVIGESLELVINTGGPVSVYEPLPVGANFDVVVMQGGGGFALVNYTVADNNFTVSGATTSGESFQSRPFAMTGGLADRDFTIVHYSTLGNADSICAYFPNGSGSMLLTASITNTPTKIYQGVAKLSETRLVAFRTDNAGNNCKAELYGFNGSAFSLLYTLTLDDSKGHPDYCMSCSMGGKAVFVGGTGTKYIVITNTADVLSVQYSTTATVHTTDVLAIGDSLALSGGQRLTWSGTDFTTVQATLDNTDGVAYDGTRVFEVDQAAATVAKIRLADSPYTKTSFTTHYDSYPGAGTDYVFIPQDSSGDNTGEVLVWSGGQYIHASDFEFAQWAPLSDIRNMVATVVRERG